MSNIKKLLEDVEVEWKTLGEATNILRGKRLTRNLLSASDKYPVFHGGLEPLGYYYNTNRPADTVMIINVGASAGTVGYSSVDFWSSDGTYCIEQTDVLNNKFLYYFLLGEQHFLKSKVRVAGIPTLDAFVIEKLQIPIPCPNDPEKSLEIQKEIVRILDKFSTLTAELQAELQARKFQYEYYRNQLTYPMEESDQPSLRSSRSATSIQNSDNPTQPFSTPNPHTGNSVLQPRDKVEWKTLGEVTNILRGKRLTRNLLSASDKYPVFHGGLEPLGYYYNTNRPADTVMIINVGASAGTVGYSSVDFWSSDGTYCIERIDGLNNKFLYYFLLGEQHFLKSRVRVAGIPTLDTFVIEKLQIPIPYPNDIKKSLEEQERIVSILDKFNTITTSITEGLPKEIELRQKQYEYYRNMLLTFPTDNIKV